MTKKDAQQRLTEIGPDMLRLARGSRETIRLAERIGGGTQEMVVRLRRETLDTITQGKREYRLLSEALARGVFD